MTHDELNERYKAANWLVAKRSASAAGKALFFSNESLQTIMAEIVVIYDLNEDEIAAFANPPNEGAVAQVQKLATGLFGQDVEPSKNQAIQVARSAVQNGTAATMFTTLLKAGPVAAQKVAAGGAAVTKGTPWAWIASAAYAVGTGGWFAYSAHAFNSEVYQFVQRREGMVLVAEPADTVLVQSVEQASDETMTIELKLPTAKAAAAHATEFAGKVGSIIGGAFGSLRWVRS
jgi:hypothetical protein